MGIQVYWSDESKSILCFGFTGEWSWADFHFAVEQAKAMRQELTSALPGSNSAVLEPRIDVVMDMRSSGRIPANAMGNLRYYARSQAPNGGLTVFVPMKAFIVALLKSLAQISASARRHYHIVGSWEEAVQLIHEDRSKAHTVLNGSGSQKRYPDYPNHDGTEGGNARFVD